MLADGIPRPIHVGLHRVLKAQAPAGSRRAIDKALFRLSFSKRYLAACLEPGAQRHDENGYPTGPVSPSHVDWARQRLQMREQQSERAAERRREKEVA